MRSHLFDQNNSEPQNSWEVFQHKILRVVVAPNAPVYAKKGSMVSYQGDKLSFEHHGGTKGLGGMMKRAVSSDNNPLMSVSGNAEVFFADRAQNVEVVYLEGDSIFVNGRNLLAFESTLTYDIKMNKGAGMVAGGLWSTHLQGNGRVAIVSDGPTMLLDTSTPTRTDTNATVAWAGHLVPSMENSMSMKSAFKGGSGEAWQYLFHGQGWVAVQASEMVYPTA